MLDHISLTVGDVTRAKAFYDAALAPLSISAVWSVSAEETGTQAITALVPTGGRISGSAAARRRRAAPMSPSPLPTAPPSIPFTKPPWPPAAATTARRVCAPTIIPITTAPSSSTPTAITSRRCAIGRDEDSNLKTVDPDAYRLAQLHPEDVGRFLAFRRSALTNDPDAFRYLPADDVAIGEEGWRERLRRDYVVGVERQGDLVGVGGFSRFVGAKLDHKGLIWGMYVAPAERGSRVLPKSCGRSSRGRAARRASSSSPSWPTTPAPALSMSVRGLNSMGSSPGPYAAMGSGRTKP